MILPNTDQVNDFHAILDGQQLLTALLLGLCESYAYKEYRRAYAYSEWSYPTRHLYLNISKTYSEEESDREFNASLFSKTELEVLEKVSIAFKSTNTKDIIELSHLEEAWKKNAKDKNVISYEYAFELNQI